MEIVFFSPPSPLFSLFPGSNERSPELKTDDGRLNREGGRERKDFHNSEEEEENRLTFDLRSSPSAKTSNELSSV